MGSSFHITHVTSVHSRSTRILENECVYLARNHKVSLLVADGMDDEELYAGVSISSIYRAHGKFLRLLKSFFLMPFILLKKKIRYLSFFMIRNYCLLAL